MTQRRLALVTGASAGIGEEIARVYAAKGFDLALTARRKDRLEALGDDLGQRFGISSYSVVADLAEPGASDAIIAAIEETGRSVDVLVNNAGYGLPGTYLNTTWEEQAAFLTVLLTAPAELTHKLLPAMVGRGWGRVVNIASLAGMTPGSNGHTLYAAVKAAMIKFSESLNAELDGTGVHATAVCPGFTYSEFHDVNGTRNMVSETPKWLWQTAREVAEEAYDASEMNRSVVVTGRGSKGVATVVKLLPDPIARMMMRSQSARFRKTDA